jgi:hypothetical protein
MSITLSHNSVFIPHSQLLFPNPPFHIRRIVEVRTLDPSLLGIDPGSTLKKEKEKEWCKMVRHHAKSQTKKWDNRDYRVTVLDNYVHGPLLFMIVKLWGKFPIFLCPQWRKEGRVQPYWLLGCHHFLGLFRSWKERPREKQEEKYAQFLNFNI